MNLQQSARMLLQKLNLPDGSANVVVNGESKPETLIVLVFKEPTNMNRLDEWEGHPVQILVTGAPPSLQYG